MREHAAYGIVYRMLVNLGDLARYRAQLDHVDARSYDEAAAFYQHAVSLDPSQGAAFNQVRISTHPMSHVTCLQLAVLATYVDDVLGAAYHYTRSVAAAQPFTTAAANLTTLLGRVQRVRVLHVVWWV